MRAMVKRLSVIVLAALCAASPAPVRARAASSFQETLVAAARDAHSHVATTETQTAQVLGRGQRTRVAGSATPERAVVPARTILNADHRLRFRAAVASNPARARLASAVIPRGPPLHALAL